MVRIAELFVVLIVVRIAAIISLIVVRIAAIIDRLVRIAELKMCYSWYVSQNYLWHKVVRIAELNAAIIIAAIRIAEMF